MFAKTLSVLIPRGMRRGELNEAQWQKLKRLLPLQKARRGRPSLPHRRILNGILWLLRTGAPWRDLPRRYGKWQTVASRFYRWRRAGVWNNVLSTLQQQADQAGLFDWSLHFADGTVIRAHQHAAGARGRDP